MSVFSEHEKMKILEDLVAIQSVNDNEIEVAEYLQDLFDQYKIESKILPINDTRVNLVAEFGSGAPVFGISGHMDVVSPGDEDKWSTPPFELTEKDGKLYGRGANDMKSGLAALAIAMIEIHEEGSLQNGTVRFLATTGEESGQAGSEQFFNEGYMVDVDALIVAEPSQDVIVYSHKGSINFEVTSHGTTAHSALPEFGYNAIDPLVEFVHLVNTEVRDSNRKNNTLGEFVVNNTIFNAGSQVNSLPDEAFAVLNARTVPEYDNQEVVDKFQAIADGMNEGQAHIDINIQQNLPSVFTSGKNKLVEITQKLGKKYFGQEPELIGSPGVTDAANLLRDKGEDFPFMMYGPGLTKMAHKVDEYVEKDVYLKFIDLYKEMITQFNNQ